MSNLKHGHCPTCGSEVLIQSGTTGAFIPLNSKAPEMYDLLKEVADISVFDQPEGLIRIQSEAEKLLKTIDNEH